MVKKQKIAIVVQRYGLQVNGGAEMHARMIAEKLIDRYDITVLTSCALDYKHWEPVLHEGITHEGNIKIIRFKNTQRNNTLQEAAYKKVKHLPKVYVRYKIFKWFNHWFPFSRKLNPVDNANMNWLVQQGPAMPELVNHLRENKNNYDAFIFFTTLYYPTALGILEVAPKSILVPTMHNEAASFFPIYQATMKSAEWIMYNTISERKFSEKIFPVKKTKNDIVAVGINLPELHNKKSSVLAKFNITQPYIIYIGRIDKSKGCDELLDFFVKYKRQNITPIQLVMVGKSVLDFHGDTSVVFTGFVSDEEKDELLMNATALVIPSKFESLSLVLLESFACKVPVIANGFTEVLKDHIVNSNGGWYYTNYNTFRNSMNDLLNNKESSIQKGQNGYYYVSTEYTWESVINKYYTAIEDIVVKN